MGKLKASLLLSLPLTYTVQHKVKGGEQNKLLLGKEVGLELQLGSGRPWKVRELTLVSPGGGVVTPHTVTQG